MITVGRSIAARCQLLLPAIISLGPAWCQVPDSATVTYRVIAITIEGNKTTKELVILRELTIHEGDTVTAKSLYARLERSRQNLQNTSLFNTVSLLPAYVGRDEVVVQVTLNERWYIWPTPIIEVADPNFNTWWRAGRDADRLNFGLYLYRYNFRGLNETVYLKLQFGYAQQYALRYKVPSLDKRQRWGMSVGGGYYQQKEITIGTRDNVRYFLRPAEGNARTSWHIDGDVSLRPRHDLRHTWRLSYTNASVVDSTALLTSDYFAPLATNTAFLAAGYSLIWDTRDARAFARTGNYMEFKVERLGLGLLGDAEPDITFVYGTVKRWWQMHERVTLATGAQGRAAVGGTVPYFVQEGLGYRYTVRGYEYYVIDGQHFALGKLNLLFQLIAPRDLYVKPIPLEAFRTVHIAVYLDLYADAGRVWDRQYD